MFETEHAGGDHGRSRFTRRAAFVGLLQLAGLGVLGTRLYQLQVLDQRQYDEMAKRNRTTRQTLAPLRGRIFGRDGKVLADTEEYYQVAVTPSLAGDLSHVLEVLGRIKSLTPEDHQRIEETLKKQSPRAPIIIATGLSWKELSSINLNAPLLPGVHTEIAGRRRYYHDRTMGRIIGYVGSVERFALDDDPAKHLPDARVGKAGVERGLDRHLLGKGGFVERLVDARGRIIRNLRQAEPERGKDVVLTIDEQMQRRLMGLLSQHRRAAGVVLDIDTGDVMAMGSSPMFDVSKLSDPITHKEWDAVRRRQGNPLVDRSVQGVYPPGSTFKMVTALAALEAGVIGTGGEVNCPGVYRIGGTRFRCWNRGGHGPCNLHRALRESCDVYFYEVARRVGITRLAEMARRLGYGQSFATGVSPVHGGLVPDPEWKQGRFGKRWLEGETLHAGIGQGYVLATPLQMAVMTARLATGRAIEPTVVRPALDNIPAKPLGVSRSHLRAVQRGMWAVVHQDQGTGKKAKLANESLSLYGKTGTSQVARISSRVSQSNLRWDLRDHALFVGYVADDAPRYAIAAIVEHGGSGGKVAAPLVKAIAEAAMAINPASRPVFEIAGNRSRGNG